MSSMPHQGDYAGVSSHNFHLNARPRQEMAGVFRASGSQRFGRRNMGFQHPNGRHSVPVNFDAFDDVVVITIPRQITQVRNQFRHNHTMIVLDDDSIVHRSRSGVITAEEQTSTRLTLNDYNNHGRNLFSARPSTNSENNLTTEITTHEGREPQINAMKEPAFTCSICLGPLVEETSTLCGHIFCKECIGTAIRVQSKCPSCRHSLTINSIHRVYLPTTTC